MARKKKVVAETAEAVTESTPILNNDLPELVIYIPLGNNQNVSDFCTSIKKIYGKEFNIIFKDQQEEENGNIIINNIL